MIEEHQDNLQVEEEPWHEKWKKVMAGINAPRDSGEYKYSMMAMQRIFGPGSAATAVEIIVILLLLLMVKLQANVPPPALDVDLVEQEVIEDLEEPEELEIPEEVDMSTLEPTVEDFAPAEVSEVEQSYGDDSTDELVPVAVVDFVKSPMVLKGLMGGYAAGRSSAARGNALDRYGGGKGTETAVLRALRWLKENQKSDGSWEGPSVAMTGLALLCYMAHGETPASPEFGPTVEKAIRFLIDNQNSDGTWPAGMCGGHYVYGHALGVYGLAESFGMTKIVMLRDPVARGAKIIVDGQQDTGAWDYNWDKGARADMSVTAWQIQALKATKLSGVEIEGLEDALELSMQGIKTFAANGGQLAYNAGKKAGSLTLTGAGVLCMQLLRKQNDPVVMAGLKALAASPCDWDTGAKHNNTYAWYYATQAKFQQGGPSWDDWNDRMLPMLVRHQEADGHWFHGKTHNSSDVYDTCLCCLSLEVYYRYLPTYVRVEEVQAAPKTKEERDIKIGIMGSL